ncbi:hypothetical protein NDA11_006205 [Ustilago hordei]|uniref:Uncharacterized protein n=1 Tax=Ustilago hordei TaxID=120017 RepID=I2FT92_USTHO|nr:uncharacterized protein UHO2_05986 [Ustilago hordei]KAJ1043797.1 hypothetical protein NDA10_006234 [Ustilago hordei]KAJ1572444.1 hypothetical protein NDA12_001448 [Ustilago hordei]KAJ1576172.1 hypothetical protein NDA15_004004 [Ustilago hordei]KAJ1593887.1 hypothetical protein NDA11_006205 [Ustilago hordei]KAJ1595502.1 hypothetical protein NDA14_007719 [Ustilago hordei]
MTEEDFENLGYTEENLFNEADEEPLKEYMDMELASEESLSGGTAKMVEHEPVTETQIDNELFGLVATCLEQRKNLDLTVCEALSGEDRKHWEEAM